MTIDTGEDILTSLGELMDNHIDAHLKELNTCLPGQIVTFYPEDQTADIQPTLKRLFIDKSDVPLPVCPHVPVIFPGGGGFSLTFPLVAGDECLLIFAQRALDSWWQYGGIQSPGDWRKHHLSDALAIIGLRSQRRRLPNMHATRGCTLRSDSGDVSLSLDTNSITLKAAQVHIEGNLAVTNDINIGSLSFNHHIHGGVQSGGGQSGEPIPS